MFNLHTRIHMAREDMKKLKKIIKKLPRDINMTKFSEHMCSVCPYMCDDCDFCFMLFKYNSSENYEKILKNLVFAFYHGLDVSLFTYLVYAICPLCEMGCSNPSFSENDCPYDYVKQFKNYKPMLNGSGLQTFQGKPTTVSYDHKKGVLVRKTHDGRTKNIIQVKPHITLNGEIMTEIVNRLWGINEDTSKKWINTP